MRLYFPLDVLTFVSSLSHHGLDMCLNLTTVLSYHDNRLDFPHLILQGIRNVTLGMLIRNVSQTLLIYLMGSNDMLSPS